MSGDARAAAGLFRLDHAGLVEVSGSDRIVWLNGMVSNDVAALEPGRERSGCHAVLLTNRGAIVADMHVVLREDRFWLLVERAAAGPAISALDRFIVADDVTLTDESDAWAQWTLEGPAGAQVLVALEVDPALEAGCAAEVEIAGHTVTIVAIGVSGEWACRIIAPTDARAAVEAALLGAGAAHGLELGDDATLEMLRIEAGTPRQGLELDDTVLPDEARLDSAISATKGCYVGQEIVARVRSRGQVNHLLVGLRFDGEGAPPVDADLHVGDKRTGEITSVARSPRVGWIALGYVRREHSEPGTVVTVGTGVTGVTRDGRTATVAALPFVSPGPTSDDG